MVDFPLPLYPTNATTSPFLISKSIDFKVVTLDLVGYWNVTFLSVISPVICLASNDPFYILTGWSIIENIFSDTPAADII